MKTSIVTLTLLGLLGLSAVTPTQAQVTAAPSLINFQGRLATPSGNPVPDGTYSIRFSLWDAVSAGNEKWNKTVANVTVKNGTFAVTLDTFPAGTFNGNIWLEVKIGTDAALTPRTPLFSVPYAFKSDLALTVPDGSLTASKFAAGELNSAVNSLAWLLGGNAGTNPASQFFGTTDNQPLVFKTNNVERLRLLANGNVGIGTNSPTNRLQINNSFHDSTNFGLSVSNAYRGANIQFTADAANQGYGLILDKSDAANGSIPLLIRSNVASSPKNLFYMSDYGTTFLDGAGTGLYVVKPNTQNARTVVGYNNGVDMGYFQILNSANQIVVGLGGGAANGGDFFINDGVGITKIALTNTGDSFLNGGNVGIGTDTPTARLHLNGAMKINANNPLEFGAGVAGKEVSAGKIGYQTFTAGALDIVGAGTSATNRKIKFFTEGGATFTGTVSVPTFQLTTGAGANKVLTSDASGNATWQTSALNGSAGGDLTGTYPNPTIAANAVTNGKLASDAASLAKVSGGIMNSSGTRIGITGSNFLEWGLNVAGKEPNAGRIGYQTYSDSLDIVGAGTTGTNRKIKFWNEGGATFTGAVTIPSATIPTLSGNVTVGGELTANVVTVLGGSDVAEPYHVAASDGIKPLAGMLVCIDDSKVGQMRVASRAYDTTVAGIISGANGINPGITLRQKGTIADGEFPVASIGRVWCWCDADAGGEIKAGDLLTSSDTLGHAMKATDKERRDGAVIGKAMSSLKSGKGLVLVLVSLK